MPSDKLATNSGSGALPNEPRLRAGHNFLENVTNELYLSIPVGDMLKPIGERTLCEVDARSADQT